MAKQATDPAAPQPRTQIPYVPDGAKAPEFTWQAVLLGIVLGILFGASSLYLVLKVGLTVSASIPVAVLSITLFRGISRALRIREATILENNIVQTTGSAGESLAFGIGVTMPALLLLGHDMSVLRIMTVGVLGGLLGILMMIPLRRAFIVRQHGKLTYPEGTACAEVLIVGEEGGSTAKTVFLGIGVGFVYKLCTAVFHLWKETPVESVVNAKGEGLPGSRFGGELVPELLGVGYIIGPRVASIMLAGGVLSALVLAPLIAMFAANQSAPVPPAHEYVASMDPGKIHLNYILYIGAGAVTAGGIVSMFQAFPLIFSSLRSGLNDLMAARNREAGAKPVTVQRTQRDLPLWITLAGSAALVVAMMGVSGLGLGFNWHGLLGAALIVLFGFLFVTVSARLTGEIGSSSNPISGMTVATLLFTCLVFLLFGKMDKQSQLAALSIAAIVCVASSNGGTTAQDLKTGYLVGATPLFQQVAIVIGAATSALFIGVTLLLLNQAGTVYSKSPENLPRVRIGEVDQLTTLSRAGGQYADDTKNYHVLDAAVGEYTGVPQGRYLVDDQGLIRYFVDPAINGRLKTYDDGTEVSNKFEAPKTRLMALIIGGLLNQRLPWGLVFIGVLIAVTLELAGVPSLPFAVGVYLPITASVPIFCGGVLRWIVDWRSARSAREAESSPGVLLSSGYIAGGTLAGMFGAFLVVFTSDKFNKALNLTKYLPEGWEANNWPAVVAFSCLGLLLLFVGLGKMTRTTRTSAT